MHTIPPDAAAAPTTRSPTIELEVRTLGQLFNPIDPSPLEERDLHGDVEEFIVSSLEESAAGAEPTLRIHIDQWPADEPSEVVRVAVHHYFGYRVAMNRLEFRRLMKRGRSSLVIGLLFLTTCLMIGRVVLGDRGGTWGSIVRESLTIAGWVAMWRPMEVYLYDWWPLRRRGRLYERLARIPVEVMRKVRAPADATGAAAVPARRGIPT